MARERNGAWQGDLTVAGRRYREQGFPSKADALAWEAQAKANILNGKAPPPGPLTAARIAPIPEAARAIGQPQDHLGITLGALRDACLADPEVWKGKRNEYEARRLSQRAVDHFGENYPASSVSSAKINEWRLALHRAGLSNQTVNNHLNALAKMLRAGVMMGELAALPVFQRMSAPPPREVFIPRDEVGAWRDEMLSKEPELGSLVVFLLEQGCRVREALKLTKADVEGGRVRLYKRKNGDDVFMPQTPRSAEAIAVRLADPLVACGCASTKLWPMSYMTYRNRLQPWLEKIGQAGQRVAFHLLRHTTGTAMASSGMDLARVGEWLGHRTLQTTKRYAKYDEAAMRDIAQHAASIYGPSRVPEGVTEVTAAEEASA